MAEKFSRAMREPPEWSNSDDPGADRLGAYDESGELHPQPGTRRVGSETGPATAAGPVTPAGKDADLLQAGGPGDRLGGPHATDLPGEPGRPDPGASQPQAGQEPPPGKGQREAGGEWAERLDP
jgi:hypothetical protein